MNEENKLSPIANNIPSREVTIANLKIGANNPVLVQTMLKVPTTDTKTVLNEIESLANFSLKNLSEREQKIIKKLNLWALAKQYEPYKTKLLRLGIPDEKAARALKEIVKYSPLPIVADIHFDWQLALQAIEAGVAKIRINPGNLGGIKRLTEVVKEAQAAKVPIRVGINAGSLPSKLRALQKKAPAQALAQAALENVKIITDLGYEQIVISAKANDPKVTIEAYKLISQAGDFPLHIGITEAGVGEEAMLASWGGLGTLLSLGIGDTIRISLSESPQLEVISGELLVYSYLSSK